VEFRPHRTSPALVAAAVALVPVGAALLVWNAARQSTEVRLAAAVESFRHHDAPPAATAVAGVPAAGVYTYTASGSERAFLGPASIRRPVPAEARYVVTPSPGGWTAELRVSEEHTEAMRYRVGAAWTTMTWRRVDVTFLGVGRDDRRPLTPAVPWMPRRPEVGARWDVAYSAWKLRTTGTSAVVGRESITLDGRAEPVFVVASRTVTTGAHGGPRTERVWWSPRLSLPLRIESDTRLGGAVGFSSRVRLDLRSGVPQR
jgi:hypothetical protein